MSPVAPERRVYHISPWRFLWIWFAFGPIILAFFAGTFLSKLPNERAGLLFGGSAFLICVLFVTLLVLFARLEISDEGIRLKQIGYRLEAPWSNVIHLRLHRGHEAFVTSKPVGGQGAGTLAAAAGFSAPIASFYHEEQQSLLDEHRLIPIEAFARHLRHGSLREQIERCAPHLRADLAMLDAPPPPVDRPKAAVREPRAPSPPWTVGQWIIVLSMPILASSGILLGLSGKHTQAIGLQALEALSQAMGGLYLAYGARDFFRRGAWIFGSGMALISVLLALWAFASASGVAEKMGAGAAFMQAFAMLLFALLALRLAIGVRNAFRRRYWILGSLFLLFAVFLAFCAIQAGFDFAQKH